MAEPPPKTDAPPESNRMRLRITRLADQGQEDDLAGTTAEQRLQMMWPLALTAWAFMGEDASELGLPRRFARLIRRKR